MFIKLAWRNVKRQMGNYLIYFMTVAFTVALMFAVNNIIFSSQLQEYAQHSASLGDALTAITVFISLIVAFVLSYATSFMLKLRKREFGTYLTLGMNRRDILCIFLGETLLLCGVALGAGILMGLLIFQCFMALMMRLMDMEFVIGAYSGQGLVFTIVLVAGVFLVASLSSALYLRKVSIYQLIHGEKKVEKGVRHPGVGVLIAAASFAGMIYGGISLYLEIRKMILDPYGDMEGSLQSVVILVVCLVLFHIALARGAVGVLLKNRRFGCRGTNTFLLRELGGTLRSNSIMLGVLAALLGLAVTGANLSFMQKISEEEELRRDFPYDIMYGGSLAGAGFSQEEPCFSEEEAERLIEQYADIRAKHPYTLYTDGRQYFYGFTRFADEDTMLHDYYMSQSDFNSFVTPLGYEPVHLDQEYFVVANDAQMNQIDWSATQLTLNGKQYRYVDAPQQEYRLFQYVFFFVVVPDEAVCRMTEEERFVVYELEEGSYDLESLRKLERALTYTTTEEYMGNVFEYEVCDYYFREFSRLERCREAAIFIVGALYVASVFLLMAMAVLALKTLSQMAEEKRRYQILYRLGAGRQEQCRTLRRQTFCFFFLPFAIPLLWGIPLALGGAEVMRLCDLENLAGSIYVIAAVTGVVMTLIYVLYYLATYLIAKREIIG